MRKSGIVILVGCLFLLIGCEPETVPPTEKQNEPVSLNTVKGLEGCKLIRLNTNWYDYRVIRCSNSSTTTEYTINEDTEVSVTVVDEE